MRATLFFPILLLLISSGPFQLEAARKKNKISSSGLSIPRITVGEDSIHTDRIQLIEVVIKNSKDKDIPVVVKLMITLPNRNIITFGKLKRLAKAKSETRALFDYKIKRYLGGDYSVGAKIYSTSGRVLVSTEKKQSQYFFAIDPTKRRRAPNRVKRRQILQSRGKDNLDLPDREKKLVALQFDPPDLTWEQVEVINKLSVLRGETTHARLILANSGGDIATNVEYSVKWFFSQRPKRQVRLFWDKLKVIAPGERKVIELPITIPDSEQKGQYQIKAVVDEPNLIKESDENNNDKITNQVIIFSDVALVFPEESYSFAEDGLFKFQWRSHRYNQFKVQISATKEFGDEENLFELPKGDNWIPSTSIKPLRGEMPSLALALMNSNDQDHLFWRVKAKNSDGKISYSASRKFYINLKATY